jgi:hypothetical protein
MDELFDARKVYAIKEFWATLGISQRTGDREMARGNSPVTTQLSARRVGVLGADANAYVNARRRVQSARDLIDSNWKRVGAAATIMSQKKMEGVR